MSSPSSTSDVVRSIVMITAAVLPLTYVASGLRFELKASLSAAIWAAYLGAVEVAHAPMPIHTIGTMMTSVFAFTLPLKATELLLFKDQRVDPEERSKRAWWVDVALHVGDFMWMMFPVYRPKPSERRQPLEAVLYGLECLASAVIKTIAMPIIVAKSHELSTLPQGGGGGGASTLWTKSQLLLLFCANTLCGSVLNDMMSGLTVILTLGRYECLVMNNYPFLSTSVRELWGKRYNRLINEFLKDSVYKPARRAGYSRDNGSLMTFAMSGILHVWVARHTFRRGYTRTLFFFVLQAALFKAQEATHKMFPKMPKWLKMIETIGLFLPSLYLYGGLFVEAYPEWLEINPVGTPAWLTPIVKATADMCHVKLLEQAQPPKEG